MSQDRVEALKEAILSQAHRDRERLMRDAASQVQRIIAQAEADAQAQRAQLAEEAESKVVELKREVKGSARLEAQALKVRKRESLLEEVFNRAAERLSEFDEREDYGDVVVGLVRDGMTHLGDTECVVILADDVAKGVLEEATVEHLEEQAGCIMVFGDPLPQEEGEARRLGIVVQSQDGRLRYNNTLQARLARMRGNLRTSTYRILVGAA